MITFKQEGDFRNFEKFLNVALKPESIQLLEYYGRKGVDALASATPTASGETASSWNFEIVQKKGTVEIYWSNSHTVNGVNIALILQYGHGTGTGGYVQGIDYINPAIRPIFEEMSKNAWKEVMST